MIFDGWEEIEKGYRAVTVPPAPKRAGYQYQRYFPENKRENAFRGKNPTDDIATQFKDELRPPRIRNLQICTDEEFSHYVDDMFSKNYKDIPAVVRLPNLNGELVQKLHLANVHCYIVKEKFGHINPKRKGGYNQEFRIEEYKQIPQIIRSAKKALYNTKLKNFSLFKIDAQDKDKVNTISFNKDRNGNYLVTIGKKDRRSFGKKTWKLIRVGVAPTIHGIEKSRPATRLLASPINEAVGTSTFVSIRAPVKEQKVIKSLATDAAPHESFNPGCWQPACANASHLSTHGKSIPHINRGVNRPMEIKITDITEGNRAAKFAQLEKCLRGGKPDFVPADGTRRLPSVNIRIKDYSGERVEKALRTMSMSLGVPAKPAGGEAFLFRAQEDLTDRWARFFSELVNDTYGFVTDRLGLPKVAVMSKSDLTHRGRVLYSPETGEPIKRAEWERFVKALEKFLNRGVSNAAERIVLDGAALGHILDRMVRTNSLEAVRRQRLEDLKFGGRTFDWISDSVRNMKRALGESLSRQEQARIQVVQQSAAERITRVSDSMRSDIRQILIDGIANRKSKSQVSQSLFDRMAGHNRDFQRIADTEVQRSFNNAFIREEVYGAGEGEKVYFERVEVADGNTCDYCRRINGRIAVWSETPLAGGAVRDEHAELAIWEGKEWDGKKLGSIADAPVSVCHPWCRGVWIRHYPTPDKTAAGTTEKSLNGWEEQPRGGNGQFGSKGKMKGKTKTYTNKAYLELSDVEKKQLIERLKSDSYSLIAGAHIADSKIEYEDELVLAKELKACKILAKLGHEVYLLPYDFAKTESGRKLKSSDTITDDRFLEIKETQKRIRKEFHEAKEQGQDVMLVITGDIPKETVKNEIGREIGKILTTNKEKRENATDFKNPEIGLAGKVYLHFENSGETLLLNIETSGTIREESPRFGHTRNDLESEGSVVRTFNIPQKTGDVKIKK